MELSQETANGLDRDSPSITELLLAVGRKRDEAAFSKIYKHFSDKAFSLAFQITHSRALAEEAVQEGMLRVWKYANSFDAKRSPRNWVLTVVAKTALSQTQKRRHAQDQEKGRRYSQIASEKIEDSVLDQEEEIKGLRVALAELPAANRNLLLLYFGAGMSQKEIGKTLGMPQRTVSLRIESILNALKTRLAQTGFAATAALLSDHLDTIFTSGYEAPGPLADALQKKLATIEIELETAHAGSTTATASTGAGIKWLLGSTALVAACALGTVQLGLFDSLSPANSASSASSERKTPASKEVYRRWIFKVKNPQDLKLVYGRWSWQDRPGTNGEEKSLAASPNPGAIIMPRLEMPRRPFILTLSLREYLGGDGNLSAFWCDGQAGLARTSWKPTRTDSQLISQSFQLIVYVHGRWIVCCEPKGNIVVAYEYTSPLAGRFMSFFLRNYRLDEIELRTADPATFPDDVLHVEETIKTRPFRSLKMARRTFLLPKTQPILKRWSFTEGPPDDLDTLIGQWQWRPQSGNTPAGMHIKKRIMVKIPFQAPPRPMLITAKLHFLEKSNLSFIPRWFASKDQPPHYKLWRTSTPIPSQAVEWKFMVWDRYLYWIESLDAQPRALFQFEVPYRGIFYYFDAKNIILQDLEFKEMTEEDIPEHFKNPERLIEALEKEGVQPINGGHRLGGKEDGFLDSDKK